MIVIITIFVNILKNLTKVTKTLLIKNTNHKCKILKRPTKSILVKF